MPRSGHNWVEKFELFWDFDQSHRGCLDRWIMGPSVASDSCAKIIVFANPSIVSFFLWAKFMMTLCDNELEIKISQHILNGNITIL